MVNRIDSDVRVDGTVTAEALSLNTASITNTMCSNSMALARAKLAQDTLQPFTIPLTAMRVHDAMATVLPGTAATDDLGLDSGTIGTEHPHLTAGDLKAAGATTRHARFLVPIPAEYDTAETVLLRVYAGMLTTVADTSCTVDAVCYKADGDTTVSADLCATAATTMNSLTFANVDFTITSTALVPGDWLDIRLSITCTDAATGTAVEPVIGTVQLLCDIRG